MCSNFIFIFVFVLKEEAVLIKEVKLKLYCIVWSTIFTVKSNNFTGYNSMLVSNYVVGVKRREREKAEV